MQVTQGSQPLEPENYGLLTQEQIKRKISNTNFESMEAIGDHFTSTVSTGTNTLASGYLGHIISSASANANKYAMINGKQWFKISNCDKTIIEYDAYFTNIGDNKDKAQLGISNNNAGITTTDGCFIGHSNDIAETQNKWFFVTWSDSLQEDTEITAITQDAWNKILFELTSTSAKLYINGTLIATHTTKVPRDTVAMSPCWIATNGLTAVDVQILVKNIRIVQVTN